MKNFTSILCFLLLSCTEKNRLVEYGDYLNCDFNNEMKPVYIEENYNLQDYSNFYLYRLTNLERDKLINDIYFKIGDSTQKDCWKRYGDIYSFEISDSTINSGYYLKAIIANSDYNILAIEEVKWK